MVRGPVTLACNLAGATQRLTFSQKASIRLASDQAARVIDHQVELPPESVAVLGTAEEGASRPTR
jgi:hypothetical protein